MDIRNSIIITIILSVLCVLLKIYYPKFRGYMGEFWLKRELRKLPKNKYIVLNNIMLEDNNGTHQIDHIVLSNYGIFIIEMKNYYGLIRGREYDNKWYQYLGRNKYPFMNPIHQNYGHIKCLADFLNLDEQQFRSIVCFSNQVRLKVLSKTLVTQVEYIKKDILAFKEKINEYDIEQMANKINEANIIDKNKRKNHVKNIYEKLERDRELMNQMICPKCGSKLRYIKSRRGQFIGCSNYPKCKFIKK